MAEAFVAEMVRLGRALRGPRVDVGPWIALGRRLLAEEQRDLVRFHERVVADPDRLRVVWMGQTALDRQRLA